MATPQKRLINAVVVSAGLMQKTVKVRVGNQEWNNHIHKLYKKPKHYLVHDPNDSLRTGDVVSISAGWRVSNSVRHVVNSIIAPFGSRIEERPPIPSEEERVKARDAKYQAKKARREARRLGEASEAVSA